MHAICRPEFLQAPSLRVHNTHSKWIITKSLQELLCCHSHQQQHMKEAASTQSGCLVSSRQKIHREWWDHAVKDSLGITSHAGWLPDISCSWHPLSVYHHNTNKETVSCWAGLTADMKQSHLVVVKWYCSSVSFIRFFPECPLLFFSPPDPLRRLQNTSCFTLLGFKASLMFSTSDRHQAGQTAGAPDHWRRMFMLIVSIDVEITIKTTCFFCCFLLVNLQLTLHVENQPPHLTAGRRLELAILNLVIC